MPEPLTLIAVGTGVFGLATHLARRYFDMAKEVVDVILGFVALVLTLPVWLICAILIKFSSPGPVFLVQTRVGKDGKVFGLYKFRTMCIDAEAPGRAVWASKDDPRVVSTCRWMRRSHMDELPQLLNVIKGEMSLVGPRPERPEILAELEKTYPDARQRLAVRPGITGLAQIRNGYDTTTDAFRHKLEADLDYIEHRRWGLEFRILASTFGKLNDKGAR
jgi:lipopolysaccharide/colanic/teichoic acid biosynthesis glycosyltransferase